MLKILVGVGGSVASQRDGEKVCGFAIENMS